MSRLRTLLQLSAAWGERDDAEVRDCAAGTEEEPSVERHTDIRQQNRSNESDHFHNNSHECLIPSSLQVVLLPRGRGRGSCLTASTSLLHQPSNACHSRSLHLVSGPAVVAVQARDLHNGGGSQAASTLNPRRGDESMATSSMHVSAAAVWRAAPHDIDVGRSSSRAARRVSGGQLSIIGPPAISHLNHRVAVGRIRDSPCGWPVIVSWSRTPRPRTPGELRSRKLVFTIAGIYRSDVSNNVSHVLINFFIKL